MYFSDINTHRSRIKTARDGARNIATALHSELAAVTIMNDPNLSDEGNQKTRTAASQAKRELATTAARRLRADLAEARAAVTAAAVPLVDIADDPADLIRAEQRWGQVRARLEGGEKLPQIIRTADSTTVRAIIEHAPSYIMANSGKADFTTVLGRAIAGEPDTQFEDIRREVTAQAVPRLAELNTNGTHRGILESYASLDTVVAATEPWLAAIEQMGAGNPVNMFEVALADAIVTGSNHARADDDGGDTGGDE